MTQVNKQLSFNLEGLREEYKKIYEQGKRTEFSLIIGYDNTNNERDISCFEAGIIEDFCLDFQGCSLFRGQGYWLNEETEKPVQERNIKIEVSVYASQQQEAYNKIQKTVAFYKKLFNINVEWIHCTAYDVNAKHFKI